MPTPDHLAFLNAHDAQLQRSLAVSPVLKSHDRHLHSDADSHAASDHAAHQVNRQCSPLDHPPQQKSQK